MPHAPFVTPERRRFLIYICVAMTPEARSAAINSIPLKRFGDPSEIADAAVFLATNKYANNCVINLDGGLSAI
jgi:NAD(P)-dependent dehydrogenase (short-subunit alcohol dehydrogenase family)